MATIKSFTSLEQSRKLTYILPLESADMCWKNGVFDKYIQCFTPFVIDEDGTNVDFDYDIPCWSLAALRNLLPVAIKVNENTYLFESHNTFDKSWVYRYYNEDYTSYLYCKNTNEVDACVAMIEKLHELNLL